MGRYSFDNTDITAANSAIGDNATATSYSATVMAADSARVVAAARAAGSELDRQGLAALGEQLTAVATALQAHLVGPADPARMVNTTEELAHLIVKEPSKARGLVDRLSQEMRTAATLLGSIEGLRQALTNAIN